MPQPPDITNIPPASTLDVTGLPCPVPVLKAQKALSALPEGAVLEVIASDPASVADMTALCLAMGHHLLSSTRDGSPDAATHRFLIRKGCPPRHA